MIKLTHAKFNTLTGSAAAALLGLVRTLGYDSACSHNTWQLGQDLWVSLLKAGYLSASVRGTTGF